MIKQKEENFAPMWELNPLWETLTDDERAYVENNVQIVSFAKNDIIHADGDESDCMYMLLEGKVRIYKEGVGQRLQIIRLLKPYDIFGYRACIAEGPYNSSASAFEDCVAYCLKREHFTYLVRKNGALCYAVMQMMARDLAIQEIKTINLTQKHIRGRLAESLLLLLKNYGDLAIQEIKTINLTQKHIRGRLAESLLLLLKNYGFEQDGKTIAMLMPREDLANMSNMTTANAIRTLSQFAQEGIISIDGRHIQITDETALEKISRLG